MPNLAYSTPYIESVNPENGALNVDTSEKIVVVFSDDIDINTLNERTVNLFDSSESLAVNLNYDNQKRSLEIKADQNFLGDEKYTLRLSSEIKNISGKNLNKDFISSFKTTDIEILEAPEIIKPLNQSVVNSPNIIWKKTELAEAYTVEIAEDPNFKRLVYSNNLLNDYQIVIGSSAQSVGITVDKLEFDREYFLRVRALDVIYDTAPIEIEVFKENIYYYSDNKRRVILEDKYSPIESINSIKVFDELNNAYNLNPDNAEIDLKSNSLIIDAGNIKISSVLADINYGIKKDNSSWSETVSFYYQKEDIDFKDALLDRAAEESSEYIIITKPEKEINVGLDTDIEFLVQDELRLEDINISMSGISINEIPYIESHGSLEGLTEITEAFETYTAFKYDVQTLIENNEYEITIEINGSKYAFSFITLINPLYTSVKDVKKGLIGNYLNILDDKKILYAIYDNSVYIDDILKEIDAESSDYTYVIRNLALAKTEYDLIYTAYLQSSSSNSMKLADFAVESVDYDKIEPVIESIKERVKYWEKRLRNKDGGVKASPLSVSKSSSESFPERGFI